MRRLIFPVLLAIPLMNFGCSEMKKDAKKIWKETADFRKVIDFSRKNSDSNELTLPKSTKNVTMIEGGELEIISNKNFSNPAYENKKPDKILIKALFDDIYDLIKNALLIIVAILIFGKLISFIVKKLIIKSEKRKKRRVRRHRRKRRHTFA